MSIVHAYHAHVPHWAFWPKSTTENPCYGGRQVRVAGRSGGREEGEGEGESGGEEGEEGEEEGEERGEDGATSGRLRKGPALRTTHASAAMRQLMGSTPVPLELLRMARSEPLVTAASWRWLVLLDMRGVHILDFGFRGR